MKIPLLLETINQDLQLEQDALNLAFMRKGDGAQVIVIQKMAIGELNVFHVQVEIFIIFDGNCTNNIMVKYIKLQNLNGVVF